LLFAAFTTLQAGSATWNLNPTTGDWNTAANWTPETVPNGPSDTATFARSNMTAVSPSDDISVKSIVFNSTASAFTITAVQGATLAIGDGGIVNESAWTQNFVCSNNFGILLLGGNATAGSGTAITIEGDSTSAALPGLMELFGGATAGEATIVVEGSRDGGEFSSGGDLFFYESSTAGKSVITANGGAVSGASYGWVLFHDRSSAGAATLIANPGVEGADGGRIEFIGKTKGGSPQVKVFGNKGIDDSNGRLDIQGHDSRVGDITVGSIEGTGEIVLGIDPYASQNLIVGANNLSTIFDGVIRSSSFGGSITKIGRGNLSLTNSNSYSGGTIVMQGSLLIRNTTGSGTGSGPVDVQAGSLGGSGIIAGAVTLGTGSGRGAVLSPGSKKSLGTLTLQSSITFENDATYDFALNSSRVVNDEVIANGVTIAHDAQFSFVDNGNVALSPGTEFMAIDNRASTPISGAFSNLADGSAITVGPNTYQVGYSGGDGNDLTLTVVP
jgi:autotransporter-associated beta strand protein